MEICSVDKCTGCSACYNACSHQAIKMREDKLGHLFPIVDSDKCVRCMLCKSSCPVNNKPILVYPAKCYAVALLDKNDLRKSASGGAATAMMREVLRNEGVVYGCTGENIFNVHHIRIDNVADVEKLRGSKYVQSSVGYIYKMVKTDLQNHREVLFTGTPCQIDSFRRYIKKFYCEDNFVLLDFFCHGVPSMLVWKKYTKWAEAKVGKITYASWRNKWTGWHDSWAMGIDGEEHGEKVDWHDSYDMLIKGKSFLESRMSQGDMSTRFSLATVVSANSVMPIASISMINHLQTYV